MLENSAALIESDGRFYCRHQESDNAFVIALRELRLGPGSSGAPVTTDKIFLQVRSRVNGQRNNLCFYAMRPEATLHAFGERSLAMLMIHDPSSRVSIDPFLVGASYDLTPGEARVAVALAEGTSPEDIAKTYKVSITTVRSQLKAVFCKTATTRQAELVSMLASLSMAVL